MRRLWLLIALSIAFACTSSRAPRPAPPDLVLLNGKVFTSDPSRPWVEAIAIRGDRIIAVGATNDIRLLEGAETRVVNLLGRTVVPGINDAHVHAPWVLTEHDIEIPPAASVDDVLARLAVAAKEQPRGAWLGGDIPVAILDDPRFSRDALDAIVPDHPVRLSNMGGHSYLLNSAAMRRWNISEDEADPPGGHYGRTNGRLNGWIFEHAGWRKIAEEMAKLPDEKLIESVREFSKIAMRHGITSVQSMPTVPAARMAQLSASADVPLRWRWIDFRLFTIEENPAGPVKYVLDGTPIERGAAISAPYADRPSERGRLNYSDADLRRMVEVAARTPHQLLVHLAGDAGIEKLFAAMHAVGGEWNAKRVRIEHGDMIGGHAEDARALGVVVVQNPAHLMIPELVETRIGSERMASYQPLRSMVDRGVHVALGSDGPLNPWLNVMFATIHPRNPSEALTREQAVTAYTAGSAYAEFAEKEKGTLAPGMLADLAILSQDVFTVPPPELPKTTALVTMIGGKVVHGSLDGL